MEAMNRGVMQKVVVEEIRDHMAMTEAMVAMLVVVVEAMEEEEEEVVVVDMKWEVDMGKDQQALKGTHLEEEVVEVVDEVCLKLYNHLIYIFFNVHGSISIYYTLLYWNS